MPYACDDYASHITRKEPKTGSFLYCGQFHLFYFEGYRFSAMRTGNSVRRLRSEKIPYVTTYGRGNAFEYLYARISVNVLTEADGSNPHPFRYLLNS